MDPKGIQHIGWAYKIEGYRWLFEEGERQKVFRHDGQRVRIRLFFRTDDTSSIPEPYRRFWFDEIGTLFEQSLVD